MLSEEFGLQAILAAFNSRCDILLLFDSAVSWKKINSQSIKKFFVLLIKESFLPSSLKSVLSTVKQNQNLTLSIDR